MDAKTDALKITRLKDAYGALLTGRQSEILTLFYDFDSSLSEIAEQYGVSRQAVRDSIERAKAQLEDFEAKLGLVSKCKRTFEIADELKKQSVICGNETTSELAEEINLIWRKT